MPVIRKLNNKVAIVAPSDAEITATAPTSARGWADDTNTRNCDITQVSDKTRVTLTNGFVFQAYVNSGGWKGHLTVYVNGQEIERLITGVNDISSEDTVLYEEDPSGTYIDIYRWVGGTTASVLPDDTEIKVYK